MKTPSWFSEFIRSELFAALIGALLVIPQAISFSFLAGVPPQYGLYCAIFMGFVASLLGKSPIISGPNTALVMLIGATLAPFAGKGTPLYFEYLALLTLMVAGFQLLFYLFRWYRIFDYIHPVTIKAISTSIGVLLIISSLDGIMGITPYRTLYFFDKLLSLPNTIDLVNPYVFAVAAVTIVAGLATRGRWPRLYLGIALGCGFVLAQVIDQLFSPITTRMDRLGYIQLDLFPFHIPSLSSIEFHIFGALFFPAAVIAYLGLSQALVLAKDIEGKPELQDFDASPSLRKALVTEVSLRREVLAQAVANIVAFFAGAFSGAGSINRTAINIDTGAKTKLAGMASAVLVMVFVLIFGQILTMLPMAVIYGSLFIVGLGMIKIKDIKRIMAHPIERWMFVAVILCLLLLGLSTGIAVALVLSICSAAFLTNAIEWTRDEATQTYTVKGPFNYVTEPRFKRSIEELFAGKDASEIRTSRLDVSGLSIEHSTFATPLEDMLAPYKAKGLKIISA